MLVELTRRSPLERCWAQTPEQIGTIVAAPPLF